MKKSIFLTSDGAPSVALALTPIALLIVSMVTTILFFGANAVQDIGSWLLLAAGIIAAALSIFVGGSNRSQLREGLRKSCRQILPSIPVLLLIGTVSATWMLSGVVPMLIDFGLRVLSREWFLLEACLVCAVISILSGSSWTTIATIGVAFMGIGRVMGYADGWVAGAIISGAYFGDKVSPLSDTTVLSSSSCGVALFAHIKYMLLTTVPSMLIALIVFGIVGITSSPTDPVGMTTLTDSLATTFNLTPWLALVPALTALMIVLRCNVYVTLAVSSLAALVAMFVLQPQVLAQLVGPDASLWGNLTAAVGVLGSSTAVATGSESLDALVATGGMWGMMPTVQLVVCATIFGGMMIGTGMLRTITNALKRRLSNAQSTVTATVATGIAMNGCTGDQYMSIIISSNMFRPLYESNRLEPRLLSRTVEDSVSVTSVLIPWNSCGLTQATVLDVATLTYLPCCIFNLLSPIMSLAMAWMGIRIHRRAPMIPQQLTIVTKHPNII